MALEIFNNFNNITYPRLVPYIFIGCLIIVVLFTIIATIRDYTFTLENVSLTLCLGFFASMFIAVIWPLFILGVLFIGLASVIYYPARYCRKFFW